ncbi:MAG: hypothetical protein GY754_34420 [bacterium]|nr:hypothetical protein [bacterium]
MRKLSYLLMVLVFVLSCATGTEYRRVSDDRGSGTWGPKEIRLTTKVMVKSLHKYLKEDWKKPVLVQVKRIRNRTSEHIETKMLSDEIVNHLLKRRIQFVDEEYTKAAIEEMQKGMAGMIDPDSAIPIGELLSPNVYLYGEISDNVRFVSGKRVQYLVVTLKLKNLRTGMLLWQDQKKFLKASKTDRISF